MSAGQTTKRRKAVTRRLAALARLRTILKASGFHLARRLVQRPAAPHCETGSYRPLFARLYAQLAAAEKELAAAEDAYAEEKAKVPDLRQQRDRAAAALYRFQRFNRRLLAYLPDSRRHLLRHAAITGATPRSVPTLALEVERTITLLHQLESVTLCRIVGLEIHPPVLAAELEADLRNLQQARESLEDARATATAARDRPDQAMTEVNRILPSIARALESLSHLAGEPQLAGRIMAAARR